MKKHIFTTIVLLFLSYTMVYGQITTEEDPFSFGRGIPALTINETTYKVLPPIDLESLAQEDREDEAHGIPPRFGFPHKVNYTLDNSGEWITLVNGDRIWRLSISCPNALSINLLYDKFWLPEGAKFFIYTPNHEYSIGAMTYENNKGEKENIQGFATEIMYGDQIVLEYYVPKEVKDVGVISIAYVVHGYRYIVLPNDTRDYGNSGECQVNVNCPEGDAWHLEKNAVALILVNGYRYCTGSLVNTTANDFRPLFLTADHCLGGWAQSKKYDALEDANLSHWSFYWHYESKWCSNNKPTTRSTSGAVVKANSDITDFALLQLTENPLNKSGVTPYYLGWDATGNTGGSGGVCIHHPAGDIKKIATHNITPPNSSNCMDFESGYGGYYYNSNFWRVNWRATTNGHSVTEGGSSGSPLLNSNYHVIGQLFGAGMYCANPDCSNPPADIANYGKFSVSWNWFSTIERQLKHWLDPNNTGALTHHGTFKCSGNLTVSGKTYGSSTSILEDTYCTVNISNTSYNNGAVAKYYVGNKILISPNTVINAGSNVLFVASGVIGGSKSGSNNEEFDEELSENEEMLTPPKNAIAEVKTTSPAIKLHPNPNAGTFQLETNIPLTDIANLKITNPLGATIYETQNVTSNTIQLQIYASGLHFVVVMLKDGTVLTQKMMIQR